MPFPQKVRVEALLKSGRCCCVCHAFAGRAANVHHIIQEADGGPNTLLNAITLCERCHSEAGHYNARHPLGTKFSPAELRGHRDRWWQTLNLTRAESADDGTVDAFVFKIVVELDSPSLDLLHALATCPEAANIDFGADPVPDVKIVSRPHAQVLAGDFDWAVPRADGIALSWPWIIVHESTFQLCHNRRLIYYHSEDPRGAFGNVYLSELGQIVVRSPVFPAKAEGAED